MSNTATKRGPEVITLGSGDFMVKEYTTTIPEYSAFSASTDLLGRIKGGATLEYSPEFYEAKDDSGKVVKEVITDETATLKSGIITWNGDTLKKLCSTARVTEDGNYRTVKIGGINQDDRKKYAFCFHHSDPVDGDVYVVIAGRNRSGFSLAFTKDTETVIDAEFKAVPQDSDGTLITFVEQIADPV
jgi:hypothetical protein